jgi:hypothetical protein
LVSDHQQGATERPNPWYELVGAVRKGDTVYHYNEREKRFVGRSIAAEDVIHDPHERSYSVELIDFQPIAASIDLAYLRGKSSTLHELREASRAAHPSEAVYSPFQFRETELYGMMSNYFAKLPRDVVLELFGEDGLAEGELEELPGPSATPDDDDTDPGPSRAGFLTPFKPKADSDYMSNLVGGRRPRTRRHELIINECAAWLEQQGYTPMRNAAVDLGLEEPPVLIEGKTVGKSWASPIRDAISQLYEYRYFKVADPKSKLIFLAENEVPPGWVEYLEGDRRIGVMWRSGSGYHLSDLAARALRL